jgi:hypothetical protein
MPHTISVSDAASLLRLVRGYFAAWPAREIVVVRQGSMVVGYRRDLSTFKL